MRDVQDFRHHITVDGVDYVVAVPFNAVISGDREVYTPLNPVEPHSLAEVIEAGWLVPA